MSEVRLSSFWKSSILLKSVTCSFSSSGRLSSWGRDFGFPLRLRNINNYEVKTSSLLLSPSGNQTLPEPDLTAVRQSGGLGPSVHLYDPPASED